jgi:hypothetical protein
MIRNRLWLLIHYMAAGGLDVAKSGTMLLTLPKSSWPDTTSHGMGTADLRGKQWIDELQAKNLGMHGGLPRRKLYQSPIALNPWAVIS